MAKTATAADLLQRKTAASRTIEICLDGAIAEQWYEAEQELIEAKNAVRALGSDENKKRLEDAEERIETLRPARDEATVELRFRSIGRQAYENLILEHPPTEKNKREAKRLGIPEPTFNPDTFPPAIIAASLVEPEMSEESVEELFNSESYNRTELGLITHAALEVNNSAKVVSLKKGFDSMFG